MPDTITRHRIAGTTRRSRRSHVGRMAAITVAAGAFAAGLATAVAPASAASVPPPAGNLPGCVLPAGVHWQLTGEVRRFIGPEPVIFAFRWGASGNGHTYTGTVRLIGLAPDVAVADGYGTYTTCNLR